MVKRIAVGAGVDDVTTAAATTPDEISALQAS
jgi:hypothetical protein